ncbi:hypothetical protein NAI66_10005, partial [Francisella tularensis subsp. holarctica]|nr:hypothetical protein [Francisella tularensis subsp. holarctica]
KYNILRQLYMIVVSVEKKKALNTAKTGDSMEVIDESEIIIEFIEDSEFIVNPKDICRKRYL